MCSSFLGECGKVVTEFADSFGFRRLERLIRDYVGSPAISSYSYFSSSTKKEEMIERRGNILSSRLFPVFPGPLMSPVGKSPLS